MIRKNNSILYSDLLQLLRFYRFFYEVIEYKNKDIEISIGNKKINSKDAILINLMDVSSCLNNLKYDKNSLLYLYILRLLDDVDITKQDKILNSIESLGDEILNNSDLELSYDFDVNISKIMTSFFKFDVTLEDYKTTIKLLVDSIVNLDLNKIYIIFYNSNLIKLDFLNNDNVYMFDVSIDNDLRNYNISLVDEIKEFNYDLLISEIEKLWPILFEREKINNIMDRFYHIFNSNKDYYTDNQNEVILNKILNMIFLKNREIRYDSSILDNNIKSFLTN